MIQLIEPMTAFKAASNRKDDGEVVIDCHIDELYYGNCKAVRDTKSPSAKVGSRPSSGLRAAARVQCSAV